MWSLLPRYGQMGIIIRGNHEVQCAHAYEGVAHSMLRGVSINFVGSADSVSCEDERAECSNLRAGLCDECVPREIEMGNGETH